MGTINSTTLVQHANATAEALNRMAENARWDDSLRVHFEALDALAEMSGDLADALEYAAQTMPGTAWIVAD